MKKILTLGLVCLSLCGSAQTFLDKNALNAVFEYTVTDAENHYVSVRSKPWERGDFWYGISKECEIDSIVEYNGVKYAVTSIEDDAFFGSDCDFIRIPKTVTSIGRDAFVRCKGLKEIILEEGNTKYIMDDDVLFDMDKKVLIFCPSGRTGAYTIPASVDSITEKAFYECIGLTSINIPNTVTTIASYAFYNCAKLTSVDVPNSVTSIGEGAFSSCKGLTSVNIPNSVTSIGVVAFSWCGSLTSVHIPNSVTSIGWEAFAGCYGLKSVIIESDADLSGATLRITADSICYHVLKKDTVEVVRKFIDSEDWEYYYSGNIVIPSTITAGNTFSVAKIGENAFTNCHSLTSITIPESVTRIDNEAFNGCKNLPSITIPNSVKEIGDEAFSDCEGLMLAIIPKSVDKIGESAFDYGTNSFIGRTVYCEATEKPKGWNNNWWSGDYTDKIVWGYNATENQENGNNNGNQNNENQGNEANNGGNNNNQNSGNQSGNNGSVTAPVSAIINQINNIHNIIHSIITEVDEEPANEVNIYAHHNTIIVENATEEIRVYNAMGALVGRDAIHRVRAELQVNGTGVYIVKVGTVAKRVMINDW